MVRNTATRRQPLTFAAPRFWLQPSYILQNCVGYLFWLTVLINAGIIVWLWWNGGNVTGLHDVSGLFDSIGRITGLLGAYALLVQLLLLARIPFVERLTGFDRLTVWHRRNGKLCIYLVLAHVVFITLGYALSDRLSLTGEATALLTKYPGMVAATVGTALMLVTVATSLVIVRKRLPYQTWYLVHLTAYASVVLAWFHQIPTGNELVTNVTAANYWTGMYLMTLGIVIGFRFIQPILGSFAYRLRVSKVEVENPDTVSLYITGRHLEKLRARPGQFFLWRFLDGGRWWESHPFSLSAAPDGRTLRITAKNLGNFSGNLAHIKPGTPVMAEGPFGVFTDVVRQSDRALLIAGGIGITPIRALLEEMRGDITVLYRVVRDGDILFRDELDRLSRERGFTIKYLVGDHSTPEGASMLSPQHLHELVPDIAMRDVFVCGPPAMATRIEENVRRADVPAHHIHIEQFAL